MKRPALTCIAYFPAALPGPADIPVLEQGPAFEAWALTAPFAALEALLNDPLQPLTATEAEALRTATQALKLVCSSEAPHAECLYACMDRIRVMRGLGAIAVGLPAANKLIGPTALDELLHAPSAPDTLLKIFTHEHVLQQADEVWCHTHGMEHFGLPDLECWSSHAAIARANHLIYAGVARLIAQGRDGLQLGDLLESGEAGNEPRGSFKIAPARPGDNHHFGSCGALQILTIPETIATLPNRAPNGQPGVLMDSSRPASNLDLRRANLAGVHFTNQRAEKLDLREADLHAAQLSGSRFTDCRLNDAFIEETCWSGAILRLCSLDAARSAGACFDDARLEDSSARGANLENAGLRNAHLSETSFERAVLRHAVLNGASGDGVVFRGADLTSARLSGVQFEDADFRGANLQGADLSRGRFHRADFRGAILEGTRFEGADCAGALFDEGAGPHGSTASNTDTKDPTSFEHLAGTALRQGLATLPDVLASPEGTTAELLDRIQHEFEALADGTKGGSPIDLKAVLTALNEEPSTLRNALAAGGVPATQMIEHLERLAAAFDANPDQPPEEWKPWLEPLMKMTKEGQALDLKVLFDALAALTRGQKPPA